MNKDIFVNETKKIIDLLKILNSTIVGNVAQLLEIKKCLKIFHFPQKRLTTLMRRSFCNKFHNVFYVDSDSVLSRSRRAQQYEISVELASTLKNNFHPQRRLTDMLDRFLESSDNA